MKKIFYLIFILSTVHLEAQVITPVIKAGFGVEGDLAANYFNFASQPGNDDWFNNGQSGTGIFVIDTSGAAQLIANYAGNAAARQVPFSRAMNYPVFSQLNNKLLMDAVFIRDYHGNDSTVFANGASKNGDSPANWSTPAAQSVPDKNEILDMMVHVRRDGVNSSDSLWMFGGLSIENTTGDRYFDFEMYQTNLSYDKATQKFYGYGPDAGHTSWLFDASGNVVKAGDIIFSAEYGNSNLTAIEARIWINKASMSLNPVGFNWSGIFDGAASSSQYGYAVILPKSSGSFYSGIENSASTWAGPFNLIRGDNSLVSNYIPSQFMEFSVNLTKLGLDPITSLGGKVCDLPFRRILVKSRSSTSFTSALKDFIAPFEIFAAPKASVNADQSVLCGLSGISHLQVTNPISTSTYTWSTTNGHIAGSTTGTSINVDSAGTYVVTQQLQPGCSTYASDTILIFKNSSCFVLDNNLLEFKGNLSNKQVKLDWSVVGSALINNFEIEKSTDGTKFTSSGLSVSLTVRDPLNFYTASDLLVETPSGRIFYRLKILYDDGNIAYSKILAFSLENKTSIIIAPNPVKNVMILKINSLEENKLQVYIFDVTGRLMKNEQAYISKGNSTFEINDFIGWQPGIYFVNALIGKNSFTGKIILER